MKKLTSFGNETLLPLAAKNKLNIFSSLSGTRNGVEEYSVISTRNKAIKPGSFIHLLITIEAFINIE